MKKIITFLFFFSLFSSNICFSQSGWFALNSGTTNQLHSVYFADANTGLISGGSIILKTINGGNNWTSQNMVGDILTLSFVNRNIGYCVSRNGPVYKTTNGGQNWIEQNIPGGVEWKQVFFIDSVNGFTIGYNTQPYGAILLKTSNGGLNWNIIYNETYVIPYSIFFTNVNTGYSSFVAGQYPSAYFHIYKTTNGGNSYTSVYTWDDAAYSKLMTLYFINENTGFAGGYKNHSHATIMKTINSGLGWNLKLDISGLISSIHFPSSNIGFAVGRVGNPGSSGLIVKTTNGGDNWIVLVNDSLVECNSVYFTDNNTGYAVGINGCIYKTTNGGGTVGITQIGSEIPKEFNLYNNYPNPFNPVTKIKYSLPNPSKGGAIAVRLIIYDVLGREIETLVNESQKPGAYEVSWDGSRYASGVYFYRLYTDDFAETKKMVLIK